MGVGIRLKEVLRKRGMTIKQLSELSGVPVNTLYSITKRDSNRVDVLILNRIAEVLNISTDVLNEQQIGIDMPDKRGKTETFFPWTKADQTVFDLGGFEALAEFEFLSDEDRAEALRDINKFVQFTLSKYKQPINNQNLTETPLSANIRDTIPLTEGSEKPTGGPETPPEDE